MDNVHQPNHYTHGEIETIDYIRDKLTKEEFIGYCIGNVMKYTSRYRHKGGKEDLEKANVYLKWAIEQYESVDYLHKQNKHYREAINEALTELKYGNPYNLELILAEVLEGEEIE